MKTFFKIALMTYVLAGDVLQASPSDGGGAYTPTEGEKAIFAMLTEPNPMKKGIKEMSANAHFQNDDGKLDKGAYAAALARVKRVVEASDNWSVLIDRGGDGGGTTSSAAAAAAKATTPLGTTDDAFVRHFLSGDPRSVQELSEPEVQKIITIFLGLVDDVRKRKNAERAASGQSDFISNKDFDAVAKVFERDTDKGEIATQHIRRLRNFVRQLPLLLEILNALPNAGVKITSFLMRYIKINEGEKPEDKVKVLAGFMKTSITEFTPDVFAEVMEDADESDVKRLLTVAAKSLEPSIMGIAKGESAPTELKDNQLRFVREFVDYCKAALLMKAYQLIDEGLERGIALQEIGRFLKEQVFAKNGDVYTEVIAAAKELFGDLPAASMPRVAAAEARGDRPAGGAGIGPELPAMGGAGAPRASLRATAHPERSAAAASSSRPEWALRRTAAVAVDPIELAARDLTQELYDRVSLEKKTDGTLYQSVDKMAMFDRAIKKALRTQDSAENRLALLAAAYKDMPIGAILPHATDRAIGEAFLTAYKAYLEAYVRGALTEERADDYLGYIRQSLAREFSLDEGRLTPSDAATDPIAHMVNVITAKRPSTRPSGGAAGGDEG